MLYIVPTPIGNLEDITLRALNVLKEADLVLAEDTRTSRKLFTHFGITTPLKPYHAHNEHKIQEEIIDLIEAGKNLALISDAGTPGISDPGFLIVRTCKNKGISVTTLPGATAFVPALVSSGLPNDKFHFEGFLPHKKGRQTRLLYLADLSTSFVLYESPNRLVKLIGELEKFCGSDRKISVSREISKLYEEHRLGTPDELIKHYTAKPPKGEIVVVVEGKPEVKKIKGNKYRQKNEEN
jgi:16S rRNA (cytidine1402-2'-O)-methyltransferase